MVLLRADPTDSKAVTLPVPVQASADVDPLPVVVTPAAQAVHSVLSLGPPSL